MQILRLYSDLDGESRFESVDLATVAKTRDFGPEHPTVEILETTVPVRSVIVARVAHLSKAADACHHPRDRQLMVFLQGRCAVETSAGERVEFGPGDLHLADDFEGKGHLAISLTDELRVMHLILADQERPPLGPLGAEFGVAAGH